MYKRTKLILTSIGCIGIVSVAGVLVANALINNTSNLIKNFQKLHDDEKETTSSLQSQVIFDDENTVTTDNTIETDFLVYFLKDNEDIGLRYWFNVLISFSVVGDSLLTLTFSTDYENYATSYNQSTYESYFELELDNINSQVQDWLNIYLSDETENRGDVSQYLYNQSYTVNNLNISFSNGYDEGGNAIANDTTLNSTYDVSNTYQDKYNNVYPDYVQQLEDAQNEYSENMNEYSNQIQELNDQLNTENTIRIALIVIIAVFVIVVIILAILYAKAKRKKLKYKQLLIRKKK